MTKIGLRFANQKFTDIRDFLIDFYQYNTTESKPIYTQGITNLNISMTDDSIIVDIEYLIEEKDEINFEEFVVLEICKRYSTKPNIEFL